MHSYDIVFIFVYTTYGTVKLPMLPYLRYAGKEERVSESDLKGKLLGA